jgi:murein L,D-transpeptidase YcbB/YkuD
MLRNHYKVFLLTIATLLPLLIFTQNHLLADHIADPLGNELHNQIIQPDVVITELMLDWSTIEHYYRDREYRPVWVTKYGPHSRAIHLRQALRVADQEGLDPADYHLETINQLWSDENLGHLATLDIYLTDAFFRYALDVSRGRYRPDDTNTNGQNWHISPKKFDVVNELNKALHSADFEQSLQNLVPQHVGYQRLRDALISLQQLANRNEWLQIPVGPTLRPGMWHPDIHILRQRLSIDGTLPVAANRHDDFFDQTLSFAVQRFQVRHGLKMDGIVGPATRAALNIPIEKRIQQIRINMERWRWLPRSLGNRYIVVNTAAFNLAAIDNNRIEFTMWVVIGKEQRQTPVINGNMHTIVINPYWTVPVKLVFEDLIPAQQANPNYMKRRKIRVLRNVAQNIQVDPVKTDWSKYNMDNFPYVVRQDPGPRNPLGDIKFLFSNKHDIYLHDTPKQYLFNRNKRAFSAGCIRIEKPVQLATFLLADQPAWNATSINRAIASKKTQSLKLTKRTPVYLLYLTSWVGEDDTIFFFDDVYERDQALLQLEKGTINP